MKYRVTVKGEKSGVQYHDFPDQDKCTKWITIVFQQLKNLPTNDPLTLISVVLLP